MHTRQTAQSAVIHKADCTPNPSVLSLHLLTLKRAILQLETCGHKPGKRKRASELSVLILAYNPSSLHQFSDMST